MTAAAIAKIPERLVRSWQDTLAEFVLVSAASTADPVIDRQRTTLVLSRSKHIAALFAPLTLIWIAIDAFVLPAQLWATLALARVVVAAILLGIATSGTSAGDVRLTDRFLTTLYGVPIAFFLFANLLLAHAGAYVHSLGLVTVYYYSPFIMAAGIGFFPLTLTECGILCLQLLLGTAVIGVADATHAGFLSSISTLWLLFLVSIVGALAAMSQLQFHVETVEKSSRDQLTGLTTRGVGMEILESQIQRARRKTIPLTVLFVDLDHFKRVNDDFGHESGDLVLATAAQRIRNAFRKQDTAIRWGGEEFLVVCPETSALQAVASVERLAKLGLGHLPDGSPQTASIGIAEWNPSESSADPSALVALADRRMYRAKQAGRNQIAMSDSELHTFLPPQAHD